MPVKNASVGQANHILASLSPTLIAALSAYAVVEQLQQGKVLSEAGEETENVYFPHWGTLSLLQVMNDGRAIETAMVGREGVVGAMSGIGVHISRVRVVVQIAAEVTKIPSARFRRAAAENLALRDLCVNSNESLLSQARINVACNAVHVIESRFCRWLLQAAYIAETDTINLTQQFLSELIGVRRTSLTEVAGKIAQSGAIHYSRGTIKILDRQILERRTCECFFTWVGLR